VGVEQRADLANQAAAALFVSIHCDANKSPALNGFTILMSSAASPGAKASASDISQRLKSAGIIRRGVRRDSRGLAVLNRTVSPAVLVEAGFLSNARDAARLADAKYQSKIAEAIAGGIVDYLHR
jgi:N-acetylmuramoyl-L-alanine amidase